MAERRITVSDRRSRYGPIPLGVNAPSRFPVVVWYWLSSAHQRASSRSSHGLPDETRVLGFDMPKPVPGGRAGGPHHRGALSTGATVRRYDRSHRTRRTIVVRPITPSKRSNTGVDHSSPDRTPVAMLSRTLAATACRLRRSVVGGGSGRSVRGPPQDGRWRTARPALALREPPEDQRAYLYNAEYSFTPRTSTDVRYRF